MSFTPGKLGDVPDLLPGYSLQFFSRRDLSTLGFAVVAKVAEQLQLATRLPAGVGVFDLFTNAQAHADSTVISNCTFKNNRARFKGDIAFLLLLLMCLGRGILAKGQNILIDGNTFDGCTGMRFNLHASLKPPLLTVVGGPAVISQTDGCFWMEVSCVGDACHLRVRLIFNQGIALANWTFVNNVITGVNQGVAREAADIFIGNSVPVCFR